ncbi:MAG: hypothetical protein ACI865_003209 [Flavobacteriaceae bacterium]|jgi:uncharacterized protein (TIGR00369 family)
MNDLENHPIVRGYNKNNHFGPLLEMVFELSAAGNVIYTMTVLEKHLATPLAAHGGAVCAMMDATMGVCALSEVIMDDKVVSTIEMKISFVSPAKLADELKGTATTIKKGSRLIFVEGQIHNQEGRLIATASGTFNAYPSAKIGF